MAISLASIGKTKHKKPPRILIHGGPKVGKSTFFSQAPGAIFIPTEDGLSGIDAQAFPLARTMDDVFEAVHSLQTGDHDYQTAIIDSADWLERLIHVHICNQHRDKEGNPVKSIELAAGGYGKGYLEALNWWRKLLWMLDELAASKLMTIGVICHSRIVTVNDPETEPYDCWKLKLHEPKNNNTGALSLLQEWADIIGFATKKVYAKQSEANENKYRGIATGGRELRLEGAPAYIAGNRYGMPSTIDLKWSALEEALAASFE